MDYQYDFIIAGIPIRWKTGFPLELDERYRAFLYEGTEEPEFICEIRVGEPEQPERDKEPERMVYESERYRITEDAACVYRIFPYSRVNPERVVTMVKERTQQKKGWLYIPEGSEEEFKGSKIWAFHMALEEVLYSRGRILLHASYVETDDGAVLFTGPSGVGKSTQADLWSEFGKGRIINGDRAVIYKENGMFCAAGSPWAGSSRIYRNFQSQIRAIIICGQGEENQIRRCKGREIVIPLMLESTFPYMNVEMKQRQAELLLDAAEKVPVYSAVLRKDESAVTAVLKVFEKEQQTE